VLWEYNRDGVTRATPVVELLPRIPAIGPEAYIRRLGGQVARDNDLADNVISGSLKRSRSYHRDYGKKTYKEIKKLAAQIPPDRKARQMKKLIEQTARLRQKGKGRRS
jgi:hypothetical protein